MDSDQLYLPHYVRTYSQHKCAIAGTLAIGPSFGSMLGGTVITVSGPCFDDLADKSHTQCKFGDIVTKAEIIDSTRARCVLPMLLKTGRVPMTLSTDNGVSYDHRGIITLGKCYSILGHINVFFEELS